MQDTAGVDRERFIRIRGKAPDTKGHLPPEHAACGSYQHTGLGAVGRVGCEMQSVEPAYVGSLHPDLPPVRHPGQRLASQYTLANQQGRPAIDKALRNAVMQCIREPILDAAGPLLPRCRVIDPVTAMGDVRPGTNVRDACHQRVDVAVDPIEICHLSGDPTSRKALLEASQMVKAMTK